MPGNKPLISSIRLRYFLSYGPKSEEIPLGPLNVLIGPNASGKSNLIEALSVLRAAPRDLVAPIREGGGVSEWMWKGVGNSPPAEIEVTIAYPDGLIPLKYQLAFMAVRERLDVTDEVVENARPQAGESQPDFFFRYINGLPVLTVRPETTDLAGTSEGRKKRILQIEDLAPDQSVLSQRKDPDQYPEITYLADRFSRIQLYREWNLGRHAPPRLPQRPDLPGDFLLEDASNLALVLNDLENRPDVKDIVVERLKSFSYRIEDVTTRILGGTVQIFLHERGMRQPIPATRLSDGTLRFMCLVSILCHPEPPPVVCIEEPELGLHPDMLPVVAEMLQEAATRTQIIVTTHSDALVSALTETPNSVLVCEWDDGGTHLKRLEAEPLREWLDKYTLGMLWRMGEIGGNP